MMKKLILCLAIAITPIFAVAQIQTPQASPFCKIEQKVGLTDMTLEFSRPSMKGRTIFGNLVSYGKLWRLGANANTKITFSTDVTIGDTALKAGTYAIFATPNDKTWDIVFYSDASNWGTPQKWDESKVAAKVSAEVHPLPMDIETFNMSFGNLSNSSVALGILWEQTYVEVKISVPTDQLVTAAIDKAMNGPAANDYYAAAVYYFVEGKDIKQAKTWMDKAISMTENPAFYQLRQQSLIYAKAGDTKEAIEIAKKSLAASEAAGNMDYVKMNNDSIKEWGGR